MALRNNKLLNALDVLRETIIEEERIQTRRTPTVCNDNILEEIAHKKPLKISDFLAISGIGDTFIDQYASRFLQVVKEYQSEDAKEVKVSKEAFKVLDHYKDRLSNISRRNPNLYLGKINKNFSFDLSSLFETHDLSGFITSKRHNTLSLNFDASIKGDEYERHITKLYREINKDQKETGSYDLYIAYPYVEGVFKRDLFAIRAPLLFMPVKIIRNKRKFRIEKDPDKDIAFNRDLLLTMSKLEGSDVAADTPFIQDFSIKTINDVVIPFYEKNGLIIFHQGVSHQFIEYEPKQKETFAKRKSNLFQLKEYFTVGRYKLYSSAIQKDMSLILDSSKYNQLLEGLIEESNLFDKEIDVDFNIGNSEIDESKISYINDVNYSQEKVIDLLNHKKKLVIWGPPGTGKSQTITSIISAAVLKGQNVLVVSEKKVALDVIYSRLKAASKYAMFIDDAENKQDFYHRLNQVINPTPPIRTRNNDVYKLEEELKEILDTLDQSLDLLYGDTIQDVPIHILFERYISDKNFDVSLTPLDVHKIFKDTFGKIHFKDIKQLETTFDTNIHLREYMEYDLFVKDYPLFGKLETKISRSNRIEFESFSVDFKRFKEDYQKASFFKKRKLRRTFIEKNSKRLLFMTKKMRTDNQFLNLLLTSDTLHTYLEENLSSINKRKAKYEKLTYLERKFIEMIRFNPSLNKRPEAWKIRQYLFDAFYTGYLEDFKATHQKCLYILDKYQEKITELNSLIKEKQNVTIETFEMELYKHAFDLSNSKRIMDIKRILENTRKPSIKAFVDIFQLEIINHIRIWMMTPEVVSAIVPLVYGMFDLVIFDEASQMYVEKGIPAIYRAKQVVIAGDTKQLRPSSLGIGRLDDDDEFYEEDVLKDVSLDARSLLDLARYKYDETILNYHYRSYYEELIAFSNYAFYEGKLIVSPNQCNSEKPPIEYIYVKDGIFDKRRNDEEAKAVIKLLRKILRERKNNETIGVITFNSTQRDLIENYIDEELFKKGTYQKQFEQELFRTEDGEDKSLFVKNIENVQGDERDIIIFSMGYARNPDGQIFRRFGWLNNDGGQNRLNVAISRAKQKIYFVSSLYPEELKVEDLKSVGPKLLKDYMRYCYYISKGNQEMAKGVLHHLHPVEEQDTQMALSNMMDDIKKRLERSNYIVKAKIGIGSFNIDLGIYDEETNSYRLGILCDISNTKAFIARKDLYHQEQFLRAKNWEVYRIFSANWYSDPNKEMRNIRALIK